MVADVLEEAESGQDLRDDAPDAGPEVPRVALAAPPPCPGEGLAGVAASDAIHLATPRPAVEGLNVRPDRGLIQGFLCHAADKDCGRKGFPLDITNAPGCRIGELDAELKPADPGT
jgi:hypothetical protein